MEIAIINSLCLELVQFKINTVYDDNDIQRGCGLWINNFTVQNCVRKIFIS